MVNLKDLAAIATGCDQTIGNLVWYTIGEQLIPRDVLKSKLIAAGLDTGFMPAEIRVSDAFRRATAAVARKRENGRENGVIENYLIREVSSDKDHILRHVVKEIKDAKGRRLEYQPDAARITLNKETGQVTWEAYSYTTEDEICREADRLFGIFQSHHDSRSVRSMVYGILASMAPTPVRPSGGVYFVPAVNEKELRKLVIFLQSLEGESSEGFMVPVINTTENRDMVRKKLHDHIKGTLEELSGGLKDPNLNKSKGNPMLQGAKELLGNFRLYQKILKEELGDMSGMINLVEQQMLAMVDKLAA